MKKYTLSAEQRKWLTAVKQYERSRTLFKQEAYTSTTQDHLIDEVLKRGTYTKKNRIILNEIGMYYSNNVGNDDYEFEFPIIKNYKK